MLVPEIIQQAVTGVLKFSFLETTITAASAGTLSSQKGTGHSAPHDGRFRYTFHPRTSLQSVWTQPGGYLDGRAQHAGVAFSIKGTERGGAHWFTRVPALRHVNGVPGVMAIEADVEEWWCTDSRAVSTSFVRAIVPETHLYPGSAAKLGRVRGNGASVSVQNITVEFRDYDRYTEIFAQSSTDALPADFVDKAVNALGSVLGRNIQLVYKEEHSHNRRMMCVRSLDEPVHSQLSAAGAVDDAAGFWNRYREQLAERL